MPIQSAIALAGVGKQTVKGTAAAAPTFSTGVTGGSILTAEVNQDLAEETSALRVSPAVQRGSVLAGFDVQSRVHPKAVGLWLLGALGTDAATGAGPYTHVFTHAAALPYLSVFAKRDTNIYNVRDARVDSLELSWSENDPVELSVSGKGTVLEFPGSYTPTTDDSLSVPLRPAGGTFTLDVDSATPAAAKITGGSVKINNNVSDVIVSGTLNADDVVPGRLEVDVSFDIVPDDLTDWRTILTGTSGGTSVAVAPVYGSFSVLLTNGTDTLTLAGSRVAFTTDLPDVDVGGGPITIALAGLGVQPAAGGTPITATLINSQATY